MRVGFGGLMVWSFLMASAHGAGFMVLPVLLGASGGALAGHAGHVPAAPEQMHALATPLAGLAATFVHTLGYLAVTGLIAWLVYEKLGLALLRKAWVNLHLVWAVALIATACFTLLI